MDLWRSAGGRCAWTSGGRLARTGSRGPLEVASHSPVNIALARMRHNDIIRGLALKIDWLALFLARPPPTSSDLQRSLHFWASFLCKIHNSSRSSDKKKVKLVSYVFEVEEPESAIKIYIKKN